MRWQKKRKRLLGFFAVLALAVTGSTAAEAAVGPMLRTVGMQAELRNGTLDAKFLENGTITSFKKDGVELTRDRQADRFTFYLDFYAGKRAWPFEPGQLKVIENTEDMAHIAYIDTKSQLALEYHFVMKKGDSGFYSYVIAKNNTGKTLKVSEMRTVYRMDRSLFDVAYNGIRSEAIPRQAEMRKGRKLQDETYDMGEAGRRYTNSSIYAKYDYSAYLQDTPFWGAYGHGYGFWVMPLSNEYHSGGPLKQDLTLHYDTIICNYLTSAHFGTGDFYAPADWQKLYGPWYVYVNTGDGRHVIRDAEKKAVHLEKEWPCAWMKESLYPVKRGAVSGRLCLTNGRSAAGAQVILSRSGADIVHEKEGYIFSAVADKDGRFSVPAVRPGTYTLTAYMQGGSITDTLVTKRFVVGENGAKLGTIDWKAEDNLVIFQLGQADHRAAEFVYGGEKRNYIWQTKVPENLTFTVGRDSAEKDWYYAQTKSGDWNIDFPLMQIKQPQGYVLKLALAGYSTGMGAKYKNVGAELLLNGKKLQDISFKNDQTVYRSGTISGTYHLITIPLAADQLHEGMNRITIRNHGASLMYDTVILEQTRRGE